jgi:hypothetical protein
METGPGGGVARFGSEGTAATRWKEFVACLEGAGFACRASSVGRWHVGRVCPRAHVSAAER